MIVADRLLEGFREAATLDRGPVPRVGASMSDLGVVPEATIALYRGRVVWVGPGRRARREVALRRGGRVDRWDDCVALPGFVDAHTHLLFLGDRHREIAWKLEGRSYPEIARMGGGISATVRATRRASDRELIGAATRRLARMLRSGTTTAEVKSGYALSHRGELRLLTLVPRLARATGVRLVATYLGAHAVPSGRRADEYVREIVARTLPEVARRRLARFCDVFCEPGFFSVAQSRRILDAARDLGLERKVHADEFVASGGARLAAAVGARSAEHLLETPRADRSRLARAGVTAVLLPVTPFASLASRRAPGRELVEARVPVALGSDLSPNSWVESMPLVLAHAVYGARLTPAEALSAATVNAAHAIGASEVAGRIRTGAPADIAVFDVRHAEEVPYRFGVEPVGVYRGGTPVFTSMY